MRPQAFYFGIQLNQPPLQDLCRPTRGTLDDAPNIGQLETGVAIGTDLLEPGEIALSVTPVIRRGSRCGLEEAGGFVIQQRRSTEPATPSELGNGPHPRPV